MCREELAANEQSDCLSPGNDMIATFFMIIALLRSIRWTRRTANTLPALAAPPPPSTSSESTTSYSHQLQYIHEGDDDGNESHSTTPRSTSRRSDSRQCDESTQTPTDPSQPAMASISSTTSRSNSVSNGRSTGRLFSLGQSGHSIFSRSDSTATNTSSSGGGPSASAAAIIPITGSGGCAMSGKPRRVDSTASTISTSVFSSEQQLATGDDRRSSEGGTRLNQQRRSSGRIRRYAPTKTTIVGARRRTTGRLALGIKTQRNFVIYMGRTLIVVYMFANVF